MIRVGVISPEPTPYRAPLFDRLAARDDLDLTVIYAARTVGARQWHVEPKHRAVFLSGGLRLPLGRVLHHDYPVTPSIWRLLSRERFDCLVIGGWSVFAAQAAIVWSRIHGVPYVVTSESHLDERRAAWKRALKRLVLPLVLRPAAGALATGALSREHLEAYGVPRERIRIFANTVDVDELGRSVDAARDRRDAIRAELGVELGAVAVLYVGRLVPQKGLPDLLEAVARAAAASSAPLRLVLVGDGPDRPELEALATQLAVQATFAGFREGGMLVDAYAAADVFVLPSIREPWGVVVNEAAAAGLPLVLTAAVGAAPDLLRSGENGVLVAAGDPDAIAAALVRLADDPEARQAAGARSRELARPWGYDDSVGAFLAAVREATGA